MGFNLRYRQGLQRRGSSFRVFGALVCILKLSRRGRFLQNGQFSSPSSILPTRSMWQFWASETGSETLQNRLSNAYVTLEQRSTSGLQRLLDVFIHRGRFYGQWARCCLWRTTSACDSSRVRRLTPDLHPILGTPCLKKRDSQSPRHALACRAPVFG